MMRSPSQLAFAALAFTLALASSGCRCGGVQTDRVYAAVELVYPGEDGTELVARENALYDFGPVFMGQKVSSKVRIRNAGNALLTLKALETAQPDKVGFNQDLAERDVFNVAFQQGITIGPGDEVELPTAFRPPANPDPSVESEAHEVQLTLTTEGTREADALATFTLKGRGVSGVCDVARMLDFGAVQKGLTFSRAIRLRNPASIPATVTLGEPYSSTGDHTAFVLAEGMPHGQVTLPPQSEQDLVLNFTPTLVKPYVAFLKVRASEQCPDVVISLEGQGVDQVLTWTPQLVDCNFSPLGFEVTREVTFSNLGIDPVELAQFTPDSPEFRVIEGGAFDGSKLTVPGKGDVKVQVGCKPQQLGMRQGYIDFATSLTGQPTGKLGVKVLGGGPDIDVKPASQVSFGQVAYYPAATPASFQTRRIVVCNVGTRPSPTDDSANLLLGTLNGLSQRVAPYATVTPKNSNTQPGEFSVALSTQYDPAKGLAALVGKNCTDFTVKFTPSSLGQKAAELTLPSNDPDEPVVTLQLSANAVDLPPCTYSVSPTALNFGLVSPPNYRDLTVTVVNTGANDCHLTNVDFAADTDPAYSLPAGMISEKILAANEAHTFTVRSWPQVPPGGNVTNLAGALNLFFNSPTQPQTVVSLQTTLLESCLTIAPNDVDFGTVGLGCNSATRTFTVYNTCPTPVVLNSITVPVPGGLQNGQPGCSTSGGCPEFLFVGSSVQLPYMLQPGAAPVSFTGKFKPVDLGPEHGAFALNVTQNNQPVMYLVTAAANADTNGENTDVFSQDANPKADILLTIDNSCSMAPYQNSLASNFAAFMAYANQVGVDYHMAVTTTDDGSGGEQGKFIYGSNHPDKILTPSSVNVTSQFAAKVNVGVTGSGSETGLSPSLKALSAPLIATQNAGFLRPDANLGVVVVTDAVDQSTGTAAYYISAFLNIKGGSRANAFSFSAVAGFNPNPPSGCAYDTGPDDGRYAAVVTATKGVKEEICTQNWSQTLQRLGKTLFGYRTSFFLTATPDLSNGKTIDVKIDGSPVPQTDTQGAPAWTYDAVSNSVNFEPAYVPEPGQTLSIHYFVACYP